MRNQYISSKDITRAIQYLERCYRTVAPANWTLAKCNARGWGVTRLKDKENYYLRKFEKFGGTMYTSDVEIS